MKISNILGGAAVVGTLLGGLAMAPSAQAATTGQTAATSVTSVASVAQATTFGRNFGYSYRGYSLRGTWWKSNGRYFFNFKHFAGRNFNKHYFFQGVDSRGHRFSYNYSDFFRHYRNGSGGLRHLVVIIIVDGHRSVHQLW
ncbi:hypothetical protein SAMN05421874_107165 [Nonomuraea maritima]|uniref:Uncharacterized protein n=1 Tax=Nonomuraea maritima TaxID=683260 RepID=A0A1G9BHH7_9ACTN|nr:hypothetical protein [Nonomuraea maritima]SDK38966.1 hypothetical protein SAMN05421874_107165 [Nonomuraea maritima]